MEEIIKNDSEKKPYEVVSEKWDKRFMDVAKLVSTWSTCARNGRQVGAVTVRGKRIVTTGYSGAPAGVVSCAEKGYCLRDKLGIASGTRAEICYATHAEQNAIAQAAKLGVSVENTTLYVTHRPCLICSKSLINAGIKRICYAYDYPDELALEVLTDAKIELCHIPYED